MTSETSELVKREDSPEIPTPLQCVKLGDLEILDKVLRRICFPEDSE
jgi:hypothetical protein